MIRVIKKGEGSGEYIGRGSPLGNPFSHLEHGRAELKVSTRDDAIGAFSEYLELMLERRSVGHCSSAVQTFWAQLENRGELEPRRIAIRTELNRLYRLARGGDVNLVCFCAPLPCHGEVIQAVLETALTKP